MEIPANITPYISSIRRFTPSSHKGQNGKVMIIGGSQLFHAASRWALDVASSMVDMVFYSSVLENNDLIHEAKKEFWSGVVVPRGEIESYVQEADVVLIGPGMTRDEQIQIHPLTQRDSLSFPVPSADQWENDTYAVTNYVLASYPHKKWVVDAGALQMVEPSLLSKQVIITPHKGEYERLLSQFVGEEKEKQLLSTGVTILLKGKGDTIFAREKREEVGGGNAGMTKGGTGDVLAGLVAGLYAMTDDPFAAAVVGSFVNKKAGDSLYQEVGPFFTTNQLVVEIPTVLKQLIYSANEDTSLY